MMPCYYYIYIMAIICLVYLYMAIICLVCYYMAIICLIYYYIWLCLWYALFILNIWL